MKTTPDVVFNLVLTNIRVCSLFIVVTLLWATLRMRRTDSKRRYPPGPPSYPIIGNILQVPPAGAWLKFTKLREIYGDILFFHGLGTNVIVLNSYQAVHDFLEKKSGNYSHRPIFTVVGELMGLDQSMPLLPYGEDWRIQRKMAHTALSPSAVKQYYGIQEDLTALLCQSFLDHPEDFFDNVRLTSSRIILAITYGLSIEDADSEYVVHAEDTMHLIGESTVPGAFICDILPFLKHMPWFVSFQRKATKGREMIDRLVTKPFQHVKDEMASGTASTSLMQDLILNSSGLPKFEHHLKWMTGSLYGAGGETNYATVLTFIMAMALCKDTQKIAQEEIDRAIGLDRLPSIADRESTPYVNAVIKETMRWHPALPLGIARRAADDDTYAGYHIPKGSIVVPNIWAIAFEPNALYDPMEFIPERFLDSQCTTLDPFQWAFGFGRRVCPGRHLAENSLYIIISSILSIFDISPAEDGALAPKFGLNLVSYPERFKCKITPRNSAKVGILASRHA